MAEKMQADRFGLAANFSRTAYMTSTIPDYHLRLSLFIGTMVAEGCYDAHVMKDGKLTYDISLDKRFSKFWKYKNGPKSNWDKEFYD
jgi:hypothetical protein